ncbi:mechanosensitive ion channel domain-containing protein [Actinoallomurus rhizosphaericola]|uniref:mechanosensitive ion channel domain-containing protein n=1 Tax=Actinoallomurus rhizosphaericola TaxID=2952536 RepID=UPI002092BFCF|nr:mechanosensitive ion channel domain-containing protein [Actinoallomurus rhizosphaericola]MCO5996218.1 mechanosensitive ion channel family protein [Actinoallomurus rhizosphaericola]
MNQIHLADQVARVRRRARPWRSIIAAVLAVLAMAGSILARQQARLPDGQRLPWQLAAVGCAVVFCLLAFAATLGLSGRARDLLLPRFGTSHATMVRLVLVLIGGLTTLVLTLQLLGLPVGQLVLGGALTGVFVGIAAQQTLANLFAGIILLLSRPFTVGDEVRLSSGPLGGEFQGTVLEIGLTYVLLQSEDGDYHLPNAQVLSAAVGPPTAPDPAVGTPSAGETASTDATIVTGSAVAAQAGAENDGRSHDEGTATGR